MKSILINLLIVIVVIIAYVLGVFDFFAQRYVLLAALAVIAVLFVAALKIIGLPKK